GMIDEQLITIEQTKDWLEIEINSRMFFLPGTSALIREAEVIVNDIAKIIKRVPNPIVVEGFTDDTPISNEIYPSNWELSADRANSVLRSLITFGVHAERLSARGYGENFPIADNNTPGGRHKNRRVVILIESLDNSRWNHLKSVMFNGANEENQNLSNKPIHSKSNALVPLSAPENTSPVLQEQESEINENKKSMRNQNVFEHDSIQLIEDGRGGSSPDTLLEEE